MIADAFGVMRFAGERSIASGMLRVYCNMEFDARDLKLTRFG
jgi:hypothetical protein